MTQTSSNTTGANVHFTLTAPAEPQVTPPPERISPSALAREIAARIAGHMTPTEPEPAPNPDDPGPVPEVTAATSDAPHDYVDDDNDGKCDICGKTEDQHPAPAPAEEKAATQLAEGDKPKADEPHAYVDDDGDNKCDICGKPAFVHKKSTAAETVELAATEISDPIAIDPAKPGRFRAVLVVEEERTADNRIIAKGATKWRTPPLPLMLMTKTDVGHDGSEVAGVIERISRKGNQIVGEGRFDTGTVGLEAARLVANGVLTGVSLDGGDAEREIVIEEEDDDGLPTKALERMTALTILGASIVPFPAIGSANILWISPTTTTDEEDAEALATLAAEDCEECVAAESLTAGAPIAFPKAMFENPDFDAPTPLRVDAEGHVFGHAAVWGTCHTSFPGVCTTPPKTKTSYAHFLLKSLPVAEGGFQPVGAITIDGPHASDRLGAIETQAHYDNTGMVAAYVNVGEDEHGIWVAGVLKPGITDEMATNLCGANLSGDWRKIAGNLELVALLGVPVPGFPVAYVKGDDQLSLVAAGFGPERRTKSLLAAEMDILSNKSRVRYDALASEIAALREAVKALREQTAPLVREHLARRLGEHV